MKKIFFSLIAAYLVITSCTKNKTDYETEISNSATEYNEFKNVATINSGTYIISIEALNGTLYTGYNEIRLKVINNQTKQPADISSVNFLPLMTGADGSIHSCPHQNKLTYKRDVNYFSGYAVFTNESSNNTAWKLHVGFSDDHQKYNIQEKITVQRQANKNLNVAAFTGKDGEQYIIALVAPQKPKVAENELVAGIYKFNKPTSAPLANFPDPSQFSYIEVKGYTLQLDPRMPEPSMGNHSSPNNKNLVQADDGLYHGVVNYTMTGNWTLNFIMLNESGKILKGTEVPKDFTPGVEGVKSELYIDILF